MCALTIAGITVLPARSTRTAFAGTLTAPRSRTSVTRPFWTTREPRSSGARPALTMTRAFSKTVTVGDWPERTAPAASANTRRFICGESTATHPVRLKPDATYVVSAFRRTFSDTHIRQPGMLPKQRLRQRAGHESGDQRHDD